MLEITPAKVVQIIYQSREKGAAAAAELHGILEVLNQDEWAHLTALAWVGRGTYDASEFTEAAAMALREPRAATEDYLLGMPDLAENLEAGLEALGIDVTAEEEDLL